MRKTSFLPSRPMTKDDVLSTIRDSYRFAERLDPEAECGMNLTFETTVDQWRRACDLLPAKDLGQALNVWFDLHPSDIDWIATLEPAKKATLGKVCELIASKAQMPAIKKFSVLGTECPSAGAFLTVRTVLCNEGIPVGGIRPSTPIAPIARREPSAFITGVGRIAPNVLPLPSFEYDRIYQAGGWLLAVSLALFFYSLLALSPWVALAGSVAGLAGVAAHRYGGIKTLSFGRMKAFRDLAEAIVSHEVPKRTHFV